ncbi:DNA polymerase III subunit delta [Mycoplasma sp. Sp33II]|uniref:DNA polymerase III subunit delta n=1 Tax=unclassified Mycoplasma TaxID=2683645 RepID=UPI003AB02B14
MKIISGTNQYFINQKIAQLKQQYSPDCITEIREELPELDSLASVLLSNSLFSSDRLLILYKPKFYKDKSYLKTNKINIEQLARLFNQSSTNCVIYLEEIKQADNKFFELLDIEEKISFETYNEKEFTQWVTKRFAQYGINIKYSDLLYFLTKIPNDITIAENEINKLHLLNEPIDKKLIDSFITQYPIDDPFYFSNALGSNDLSEIYKKYLLLTSQGEDVSKLIYTISNTMCLLNRYFSYSKVIKHHDELATKLNISNKRLFVIDKISRNYQPKDVIRIISELGDIDYKIKTTGVDANDLFQSFLTKNFGK